MVSAGAIASGLSAWKYSEDSLWTNTASGRCCRIAIMARMLAFTTCFTAVTKALSEVCCSFHQPNFAEKVAVMNISLTGV